LPKLSKPPGNRSSISLINQHSGLGGTLELAKPQMQAVGALYGNST